jgi:hypothetical protein
VCHAEEWGGYTKNKKTLPSRRMGEGATVKKKHYSSEKEDDSGKEQYSGKERYSGKEHYSSEKEDDSGKEERQWKRKTKTNQEKNQKKTKTNSTSGVGTAVLQRGWLGGVLRLEIAVCRAVCRGGQGHGAAIPRRVLWSLCMGEKQITLQKKMCVEVARGMEQRPPCSFCGRCVWGKKIAPKKTKKSV